jgi:hypothetical protein
MLLIPDYLLSALVTSPSSLLHRGQPRTQRGRAATKKERIVSTTKDAKSTKVTV